MSKVAVIGAGPSGLTAIKECLECNLNVTCFEQQQTVGGLWSGIDKYSSIYHSTVVNTSKEMMSFSDFPIPSDWPTYLPHALVTKYLQSYSNHFSLNQYIKFNRKVLSIDPILINGIHSGQWEITTQKLKKSTPSLHPDEIKSYIKKYTFDFVIVANGHHYAPNMPEYPGMQQFSGKILHSQKYKVPYPFKDNTVLVVGVGNSGIDIATELSNHCEKVYLSSRTGTWILPKFSLFGIPTDQLTSRAAHVLPRPVLNYALESLSRLYNGNLTDIEGLASNHHILEAHPTINNEISTRIGSGKIVMKPNIDCFLENYVIKFTNNTTKDFDAVIFCTGYNIETKFLDDKKVMGRESDRIKLYKHVFSVSFKNIAFVGLVQPMASVLPVAEMQSRWISRVYSGQFELPGKKEMQEDIENEWIRHCNEYIPRNRHAIEVDYVGYMEMIAEKIGCKPDLWKEWMNNWKTGCVLTFGGLEARHYR